MTIAVWLLWVSIACGLLTNIPVLGARSSDLATMIVGTLIGASVVFAPVIWLTIKISQRRNWARIVFLVLTALRAAAVALGYPIRLSGDDVVVFAIEALLQWTAITLLFIGPGGRWFSQRES